MAQYLHLYCQSEIQDGGLKCKAEVQDPPTFEIVKSRAEHYSEMHKMREKMGRGEREFWCTKHASNDIVQLLHDRKCSMV